MKIQGERDFFAALTGLTLINMFKGLLLVSYKALPYGFQVEFVYKEKLDQTFLTLLEDALIVNLRTAEEGYPMTMMGGNALMLLEHQGHALLAESLSFGKKELVEMVKWGDIALPAPHIESFSPQFKLLHIQEPKKGLWHLEGALFTEKRYLKDFLKVYANRKKSDPFYLATVAGLVTVEGLWLPKGVALLESLRKKEEHFWEKRGFVKVYGCQELFPDRAFSCTPVFDDRPFNKSILYSDSPRLWAFDKKGKVTLKEVISPFSFLKAAQKETPNSLFLGDLLGSFYETARIIKSNGTVGASLFASPVQALAFLLQETEGHLEDLESLAKEMFEFSS